MIRICQKCGAKNKIPAKHLADVGKCGSCKAPLQAEAGPIEADPELFDEVLRDATVPVLVDFWAEWCGPCKQIAPALDQISEELAGKVTVAKVNIEDSPGVPSRYGVRGIPTLMLFRDGQMASMKVGAMPKQKILEWLAETGVAAATAA